MDTDISDIQAEEHSEKEAAAWLTKPMTDQAVEMCEEGIIYGAIVQLARSDRFRGYLMTDTGAAAELVESAILKRAQAFDVVVVK